MIRNRINCIKLLENMDNILKEEKINIQELNIIIEIFLMCNNYFFPTEEELVEIEKIGDYLVELVEYYNSNEDNYLILEHRENLEKLLKKYSLKVKENLRIRVLVIIDSLTDKNLLNKISKNIEVVKILDVDKLNFVNDDFEYVLNLCEDTNSEEKIINNLLVEQHRLLNLKERYINYYKELIYMYRKRYFYSKLVTSIREAKENKNVDMICTGLSYTMKGYYDKFSKYNCVNLGASSQDLYYDYLIAKDVININRNIKHCLIGLVYYSFHWDLSSTKNESYRIEDIYYPIFKDKHNFRGIIPEDNNADIKELFSREDLLKDIFYEHIYEDILREKFQWELNSELMDVFWNNSTYLEGELSNRIEEVKIKEGRERAELHNRINYKATKEENFNILKAYLKLLKDNGIKATIVVFPVTSYYGNAFNKKIKKEFYDNINFLKKEYDFQVIDLFNSKEFGIECFSDYDHLNKKGAIRCTEVINNFI